MVVLLVVLGRPGVKVGQRQGLFLGMLQDGVEELEELLDGLQLYRHDSAEAPVDLRRWPPVLPRGDPRLKQSPEPLVPSDVLRVVVQELYLNYLVRRDDHPLQSGAPSPEHSVKACQVGI